jgi:ribosomal protein L5
MNDLDFPKNVRDWKIKKGASLGNRVQLKKKKGCEIGQKGARLGTSLSSWHHTRQLLVENDQYGQMSTSISFRSLSEV